MWIIGWQEKSCFTVGNKQRNYQSDDKNLFYVEIREIQLNFGQFVHSETMVSMQKMLFSNVFVTSILLDLLFLCLD